MTANTQYNAIQARVLKKIIHKAYTKTLDELTRGKTDYYFINVYNVIYKSILHLHDIGEPFGLSEVLNIATNSKLGKKYTRSINEAVNDLKKEVDIGIGFRALVARMVYFKNTHKGEIKENLTSETIEPRHDMATQKQVWYLEFIRRCLGLKKWNRIKKTLSIGSGTNLTKIEASKIIDYYKVNHEH